MSPIPDIDLGRRRLPIIGFLGLVVAYVAIIKVVGLAAAGQTDIDDGRLLTSEQLFWAMIVPLGAAFLFVYAAIAALGWWRPLLHEPKPVQRWVWAIPIIFILCIAGAINYGTLADRGIGFTLTLLCGALLVGFGEEGMFRCIGVNTLRQHGLTEGKVAFWSSLTFGAVHLSNAIGGNSGAYVQAIIVSFAGYFFYLIRRVSGSNILNSVLHGLFDFSILSGTAILAKDDDAYPAVGLAILVYVICAVLVLMRRHKIEPAPLEA